MKSHHLKTVLFSIMLLAGSWSGLLAQPQWHKTEETQHTITYALFATQLPPGETVARAWDVTYAGESAGFLPCGELPSCSASDQSQHLILHFSCKASPNGMAYLGKVVIRKTEGVGVIINIDE